MALNFPASPSNGQEYVAPNGVTYIYDAAAGLWYVKTSDAIGTSDIADSAITTAKIADDAVTGDKLANDITINTTGDVSAGNIVLPDAGGITFGTSYGGSGTGTSKVLDDYEEGTFTPTITFGGNSVGVAYTAMRTGLYTKIGRQVHCYVALNISSKGSSVGDVIIEGLPFTATDLVDHTSYEWGGSAIYQGGLNGTVVGFLSAAVVNGQSYFNVLDLSTTTAGTSSTIDNSDIQDSFSVRFVLTYTTDS